MRTWTHDARANMYGFLFYTFFPPTLGLPVGYTKINPNGRQDPVIR